MGTRRSFRQNYTEMGYLMRYSMDGRRSKAAKTQVLQFPIALLHSDPLIWRKIQVPVYYNFWDLHVAIQDAMGWEDYHLHHFSFSKKGSNKTVLIGIPDFDGPNDDMEVFPGWEIHVGEYFTKLGVKAIYTYDYGDSWKHEVMLEGHLLREEGVSYPRCVEGEMACPPEDCGGIPGYQEFMKVAKEGKKVKIASLFDEKPIIWDPYAFDPGKRRFDHPYKRWRNAFLDR